MVVFLIFSDRIDNATEKVLVSIKSYQMRKFSLFARIKRLFHYQVVDRDDTVEKHQKMKEVDLQFLVIRSIIQICSIRLT